MPHGFDPTLILALNLVGTFVFGLSGGLAAVLAVLGTGYGSLALAVFVAMAVARLLGGVRIVLAQAAVGAILVISSANVEIAPQRLVDALIGAGVALIFSQVLFTPEPVRLVRRAEAVAVGDMASGLQLEAQALECDDDEMAEKALSRLRDLRDRLSDLARMRKASARVSRRALPWRSRRDPVVRANENAGQLDLPGGSRLMLARAAGGLGSDARRRIAPCVRELAGVLRDLSANLGDQPTRQSAADRALDVARGLSRDEPSAQSPLAAAVIAARMVTTDVMVFAGVDPQQAVDAVREGTGEFHVPAPVQPARVPSAGDH